MLVVAGVLLLAGCPKEAPPPPEPPPPPPLTESTLPPTGAPAFEIDFDIARGANPQEIVVQGGVHNKGSRASREVTVWIEAVDAAGARVLSRETVPEQQVIAPGETAHFRVILPNDPTIRTVRVEALGK